ncbi:MAG: tRNA 2-thiouridine(34) synthase MnmA [Deltaproteobacteria bacterium]|nr:tRNA 2-thiouridine(34) synthase MnmA [Deltaproteobacteria bacterium]MBW1951672.1 tRNA 2-thiouridine(34) synthase MnmA [Deltaproteobacteria bacterium]MBW2134686.1 tRNA 2-thiouridine(34) synthase MnmA [Deltaproteobacteria bacterium]
MTTREDNIVISLSGGLDSAVAAALLINQGWTVRAVHLRLVGGHFQSTQLAALAHHLGVGLVELDLTKDFAHLVIDYFVREYYQGRTPNPCVRCNAAIKFGRLWEIIQGWGIDYLATGHYVRAKRLPSGEVALLQGVDRTKDQSYFVHRLRRELLPHLVFPLGDLNKTHVLALSREIGLESYLKDSESQEICFIGRTNYLEFLRSRRPEGLRTEGDIVNRQGWVLGKHYGLEGYTVGQRRGLGLCAPEPFYVLEILPETNRLVVGHRQELFAPGLVADHINWLIDPPGQPFTAIARIRYRHPGVTCQIRPLSADQAEVIFAQPQAAVTPGQAVVFYQEERVLGGGWIDRRL